MSFLGFGGAPQPTSAQKIAAAETELEMVTDMFNRLSNSCTKKCIPTDYKESELNKGESVCLDRCVSKFFEVNIKVSEQMQNMQQQAGRGGGVGAGGFGGFGQ
ncbi:Tim10/DDP family zinc finger-domain-containing protein [Trichophaea hybrida]|nr:Tim10/DDP family zinc finger-domain-containing protein [Trichophaea hybrida]